MAVFAYEAMEKDASLVAGTIIADTPRQARDQLRQRGLTITQITVCNSGRANGFISRRRGRQSDVQVTAFIRELATLTRAGIPLLDGLETLADQHRGIFRTVIQHLSDDVRGGQSLSEAMRRQGVYFDEFCVNITRVGENTGSIDLALRQLAAFKEKSQRLRGRVVNALLYPLVVCAIGFAVMIFLMTYVVPNLLSTLTQSGKELPALTLAVQSVSRLLIDWWWLLLGGLSVLALLVRHFSLTEYGGRFMNRCTLWLPVVGELLRKELTSRFAVVLSALLRSGLPFIEALQITRRTLRNRVFQQALKQYEMAVNAGRDVAAPLAASGVFSPMVVQMLAVGQQSGQLEEMLEQLAETYDEEVDMATQRLTAVLEPLLIVLLALMVGTVAFATILPILEVSNVL